MIVILALPGAGVILVLSIVACLVQAVSIVLLEQTPRCLVLQEHMLMVCSVYLMRLSVVLAQLAVTVHSVAFMAVCVYLAPIILFIIQPARLRVLVALLGWHVLWLVFHIPLITAATATIVPLVLHIRMTFPVHPVRTATQLVRSHCQNVYFVRQQ